jgi:hypothetical protein
MKLFAALTASLIAAAMSTAPTVARSADLGGWKDKAELEPVPAARAWTLDFTTYSWLTWLTGETTVRGRAFDVNATPIEVVEKLDWSTLPVWMSHAELRIGRFGVFNDIVYAKLADSDVFERSGSGGRATLSGDISADYEQATIELGGAYGLWSGIGIMDSPTIVEALAGGRYWYQDVNIKADADLNVDLPNLPLLSDGRVIARSGSVDWIDPFIGARVYQRVGPGQVLMLRGDIGGFGVGSDFSWQVIGSYEFEFRPFKRHVIDGYLGYRALSVDYSEGSGNRRYEYDVLQHGPVLGATLRF